MFARQEVKVLISHSIEVSQPSRHLSITIPQHRVFGCARCVLRERPTSANAGSARLTHVANVVFGVRIVPKSIQSVRHVIVPQTIWFQGMNLFGYANTVEIEVEYSFLS